MGKLRKGKVGGLFFFFFLWLVRGKGGICWDLLMYVVLIFLDKTTAVRRFCWLLMGLVSLPSTLVVITAASLLL